jgi:putative membrane protein
MDRLLCVDGDAEANNVIPDAAVNGPFRWRFRGKGTVAATGVPRLHERQREPASMSTLFAFLHHLAAFTLVSAIAVEFALIRQELTASTARKLLTADAVYGIAAGVLLVIGLLRVFYFEKGAAYYFSSHAFVSKLSVFIAVGVLSAIPTIEFMSWRKALKAGQAPAPTERKITMIRKLLHGELIGVAIILLCAAIMARGGFV